jgi:hypothetical protein
VKFDEIIRNTEIIKMHILRVYKLIYKQENRLAVSRRVKELINPNENIKDTLKHFNELRERWKNAGPIQGQVQPRLE